MNNWKNSRVGGWEGQAMAVNKRQLPAFTHHMTLTHPQAPVVCEKNIFHLFHSTKPVEITLLTHPCEPCQTNHHNSTKHRVEN